MRKNLRRCSVVCIIDVDQLSLTDRLQKQYWNTSPIETTCCYRPQRLRGDRSINGTAGNAPARHTGWAVPGRPGSGTPLWAAARFPDGGISTSNLIMAHGPQGGQYAAREPLGKDHPRPCFLGRRVSGALVASAPPQAHSAAPVARRSSGWPQNRRARGPAALGRMLRANGHHNPRRW